MTSNSLLGINLLSPLLYYQNPIDILQTQTGSTQINGLPCEINSCRGCNQNLAGKDPASQYQRQKLIQKTVGVYASLYTANLAGLAGYERPLNIPQIVKQNGSEFFVPPRVYWNQMSDRSRPANQVAVTASGSTYHTSSTRHTITRQRPGAMSPGGVGVDIKHNSYERYLNKIKGKGPFRRGVIPPDYGVPIPFNRAFPVYGGKVVKTAIINGCVCPDVEDKKDIDRRIYGNIENALQDKILSVRYKFNKGDKVWARKFKDEEGLYKGEIIEIIDDIYKVEFDDKIIRELSFCELFIYFDCNNCGVELSIQDEMLSIYPYQKRLLTELATSNGNNIYCNVLTALSSQGII